VLRLFVEEEAQPAAFHALTRFLDLLDEVESRLPAQPALEPLVLSFQLKLLWLSGYLPHLASCAACGEAKPLVAFSARAGGAVCRECDAGAVPVSEPGFLGIRALLEAPLGAAREAGLREDALRQCLRVIEASYEEHGGFRLRTLAQTR
jgi:DNA repair protein RecO (recombination protein O)